MLIANLGDNQPTIVTASLPTPVALNETFFNENETSYLLFPYQLNKPPVIKANVHESSEPPIQSVQNYVPGKKVFYYDEFGVVKVVTGESIALRVEAEQPDVLNVENGVPTLIPLKEQLVYEWFKDGESLSSTTTEGLKGATLSPQYGELLITNFTVFAAGTYFCRISNDIGFVDSDPIQIEVLEQFIPNDPLFGMNLIQNAFGESGTDNWTSTLGNLSSRTLATPEDITELKLPHTSLFKHTKDAFYPTVESIQINTAKNYDIKERLQSRRSSTYLSRGPMNYVWNGGTSKAVAYQDIDLSAYHDYISGKAYGCDGVRAFFGCFVGNALTRFIPTIDLLGPDERNQPKYYYSGAPRISYENFALAGPGRLEETVKVVVQEFDEEEPLMSKVCFLSDDPRVGYTEPRDVYNVTFVDTLSNLIGKLTDEEKTIESPITEPVTTKDGVALEFGPISNDVLGLYKKLYANTQEYFSHGQYVDYQHVVYDRLNPRTTRIRVSLEFEVRSLLLDETLPSILQTGRLRELGTWEKPYVKGIVPFTEFRKDVATVFSENQNSKYKDKPIDFQIRPNDISKTLVTGLGLFLHPLTKLSPAYIGSTIDSYANSIVSIPRKEAQRRATPANVYTAETSFQEAIANIDGLSSILDIQGDAYVVFYRKYNDAKGGDWSGVLHQDEYDRDKEVLSGRLTITNITTGAELISAAEQYTDLRINPGGMQMLEIKVQAIPNEDNGFEKRAFPYLTIKTANEQGSPAEGRWYHIWPSPFAGQDFRVVQAEDILDGALVDDNFYNTGGNGGQLASLKGGSKPQPDGVGGNNRGTSRLNRTIVLRIPTNQLSAVVAGIRINNNGSDTVDETKIFEMQFPFGGEPPKLSRIS